MDIKDDKGKHIKQKDGGENMENVISIDEYRSNVCYNEQDEWELIRNIFSKAAVKKEMKNQDIEIMIEETIAEVRNK